MENKLLSEIQLKQNVVNYLINNKIASSQHEAEKMLDEGLWSKIKSGLSNLATSAKHGLSKLGTITAGGKYFGQSKAKAAAQTQIDSEMSKRGNKMIRDLDKTLKSQFPGFPNVKDKEQFIAGVQAIGQVYESVVAATKLPPDSKGYLSPKKANNIIKSLRMYVQKTVDYDLASVYRMFNENDEKFYQENQHILLEAKAVAGPLTGSKETETEKVYKSNKAPLTLLGIGTALGAFSWLVNTDWFKNLFAAKSQVPVTEWMSQDTTKVLGSVQPGNGLTQTMNATLGSKLTAASSPEDFIKGLEKLGNGNAQKGIDLLTQKGGLFPDAAGAKMALTDIVKNPHGQGDTLGEIFKGKIAGTGKEIGDVLVTKPGGVIVGAITSMVPKIAMMTVIKTGAGYAAAKGLGGVLGPLGIGLIAAGALVKGLRYKGLKSSRMKTLKDLLVNMNDLAVPKTVKKTKEKEEPVADIKKSKVTKNKKGETQINYTQPGSEKSTSSYTVSGNVPTFGNADASTTKQATQTQAEPAKVKKTSSKGSKVTKKKPASKATKKEPEMAAQTGSKQKVVTAKPGEETTGTDYKRNRIGFNRELNEAFKVLFNQLHKRNLI